MDQNIQVTEEFISRDTTVTIPQESLGEEVSFCFILTLPVELLVEISKYLGDVDFCSYHSCCRLLLSIRRSIKYRFSGPTLPLNSGIASYLRWISTSPYLLEKVEIYNPPCVMIRSHTTLRSISEMKLHFDDGGTFNTGYPWTQYFNSRSLISFTSLRTLSLNSLHHVISMNHPSALVSLTHLTSLSMNNFYCHPRLPHWLGEMTNLTSLSLERIGGCMNCDIMKNLTNLTSLGLSATGVHQLTSVEFLSVLTSLTKLKLRGCNCLTSLQPLVLLTSISELEIVFTAGGYRITPGIGAKRIKHPTAPLNLPMLKYLSLSVENEVPPFKGMGYLTSLSLYCPWIRSCEVLSHLGSLSSLTSLELTRFDFSCDSGCNKELWTLPPSLLNLTLTLCILEEWWALKNLKLNRLNLHCNTFHECEHERSDGFEVHTLLIHEGSMVESLNSLPFEALMFTTLDLGSGETVEVEIPSELVNLHFLHLRGGVKVSNLEKFEIQTFKHRYKRELPLGDIASWTVRE